MHGPRTSEQEVRELVGAEGSRILLCVRGRDIVGSVHLQNRGSDAYLGMLVVRPELQAKGIGKRLVAEAEASARRQWGVTRMTMNVIDVREELIAFYERRGYRRTGRTTPFPQRDRVTPKVLGLRFEILEKDLLRG